MWQCGYSNSKKVHTLEMQFAELVGYKIHHSWESLANDQVHRHVNH